MIDYEKMISQWKGDVAKYCESRGIPNMNLKNLRAGDTFDYGLYKAYTNAVFAVEEYIRVPESPLYANRLVAAIKQWYIATATGKAQKLTMQLMTGNMFANFIGRRK